MTTIPTARRRMVLGVRVDDISWPEALAAIDAMIAARSEGKRGHHVVTANPEMIVQATRDDALHRILENAAMVTCDGVGLRWAASLLGQPLRALIPGSRLTLRLARHHSGRRVRYFLLGARAGVAVRAAERLRTSFPGLEIVGTYAGSSLAADDESTRYQVASAGPVDVLLVAFGTPAQEHWIARNLPHLDVGVAIGVGGTFDFVAGDAPWPPEWIQRRGLIWLWRLVHQPQRWRRQLGLLRFMALVLIARFRRRS